MSLADNMGNVVLVILSLVISFIVITFWLFPAFAEDEQGFGTSEKIDDGFDWLDGWFTDRIKKAELTGTETPMNTTEDELMQLLDDSVQTGKDGKNFLFSFHHMVESAIKAISPIDIDPLIVLVISGIVAGFVVFHFTKGSLKHILLFAFIFGTVIILFMIGGINPQF